ncbi:hypothetical protein Q2E61_00490 [Microbulbifer thermotolerans]|nr:hypothetical protein [Microbulbifer thermotolerans]WKT60709.1 hypothetical protein Q2E61_00490 [Microbulbifer thermotolerans]
MKIIFLFILTLLSALSEASSQYVGEEFHSGWGIEYRWGAHNKKFDFFAYSEYQLNGQKKQTKYPYSNVLKKQNMSCVPDENSKCSVGWGGPTIYILALPVSLYLYKEMFGIK